MKRETRLVYKSFEGSEGMLSLGLFLEGKWPKFVGSRLEGTGTC